MKSIFLIFIFLTLLSCNKNTTFDAIKWNEKDTDWWMTDVREKMSNDLIDSDTIISLNKKEIELLLGKPDKTENYSLFYLIREKYAEDIDPVYISFLQIDLDSNQIAQQCKIIQ